MKDMGNVGYFHDSDLWLNDSVYISEVFAVTCIRDLDIPVAKGTNSRLVLSTT